MCYVGVPIGNMLLEYIMQLGDAFLFPCCDFEHCIISERVSSQDLALIYRIYHENSNYYEKLEEYGLCILLFKIDDSVEMVKKRSGCSK